MPSLPTRTAALAPRARRVPLAALTPLATLTLLLSVTPALARPGPGHAEAKANAEGAWTELEAESKKHRDPPLPAAAPPPPPPAAPGPITEAQPPELDDPRGDTDLAADPLDAAPFDPEPAPLEPAPGARADWPPAPAVDPWDLAPLDRPVDLDAPDQALVADAVLRATNEVRRRNGLRPLMGHRKLDRAAAGHAHRMARLGFFDHQDPHDRSRRSPTDRARLAGVVNPFVAENLATVLALSHPADRPVYVVDRAAGHFAAHPRGARLPVRSHRELGREVVARWMASPGHRRNLLSPHALQMGSGAVAFRQHGELPTLTVVQVFQWYQPVR